MKMPSLHIKEFAKGILYGSAIITPILLIYLIFAPNQFKGNMRATQEPVAIVQHDVVETTSTPEKKSARKASDKLKKSTISPTLKDKKYELVLIADVMQGKKLAIIAVDGNNHRVQKGDWIDEVFIKEINQKNLIISVDGKDVQLSTFSKE